MGRVFKRIHVIVLDSVGIGEAPDAKSFGDEGANTLGNIIKACGGIKVDNLINLGIGNIGPSVGLPKTQNPLGSYGRCKEASVGKDTMTGHWEMMGLYVSTAFRVFPDGFPKELIDKIESFSKRKVIGNKPASGTDIITELGPHQMKTGDLIIYTSADSVLQIAAHEEVIPLEELYRICQYARDITLEEPYKIGRIIARPYLGKPGSFKRTSNRHDYALKPIGKTILDNLKDSKYDVIAIGKISDIFDGEGITRSIKTTSNLDGMNKLTALITEDFTGISFTNLVDFDAMYGHRRDPKGYAQAIEEFDRALTPLMEKLLEDDLLILTADHGTDPTHHGTDHTREMVPLIAYSKKLHKSVDLGTRATFADIGTTIADNFSVNKTNIGTSFLKDLK